MNKWHKSFRNASEVYGFENAYRKLKGYTKFSNYRDNHEEWADHSIIKYNEESEFESTELAVSCVIANDAIKSMMRSKIPPLKERRIHE